MDTIIYFMLMMLGHLVIMFFMPGMHNGKSSEIQEHTDNYEKERREYKKENKELKEKVDALKSQLMRTER